jgi:23S rRNA pseudouridine1911/1915/1917 synthase
MTELWADEDFRAVVKPIGVDVEKEFAPGTVIHRLDVPVSGVLLLAKTPRGAEEGRKLFSGRDVEKLYWAVTVAPLPAEDGELHHWLEHSQKGNKSRAWDGPAPRREEAWLRYRRLAQGDRYPLYEILLGTGRTHQIRVQLSAAGAPIRGDLKYGAPRSNPGGGIQLLARSLKFVHPFTQQTIALVAEPPEADHLWQALRLLMEGRGRPIPRSSV